MEERRRKGSKRGGAVVVLRSARMSAFPLSGEGTIGSLCLSLHSFMLGLEGEVKGVESLVGVGVEVGGGLCKNRSNSQKWSADTK